MPKPEGTIAWLVEDAFIPDDELLKSLPSLPRELALTFRKRIAAGGKQVALVWLVTRGRKRVWCAFAGGSMDSGELMMTEVGQLTLCALAHLPGLPANAPLILGFISRPERFEPYVGRILSGAPDDSVVCFFGDVAGALDGLPFPYMSPMGQVKAAVEIDDAGWPRHWRPLASSHANA
jgi:hypothetical protein